jgi:hypothetical protein
VPKANELKAFFAVNPHLLHWTADALIDGSIRAKKVALRGQAHDAWPHIGDKMLDRIIKSGSIAGMQDEVPLSGFDAEAEDEIDDCEGCKARMHAPVRRNTPKPVQIKPGDVAVDIQVFKCKQVGSVATYATAFVLLWWCLPCCESHGSEKGGFEMAVDNCFGALVTILHLIDERSRRRRCKLRPRAPTAMQYSATGTARSGMIMVSPQGGAHALVNKLACVLTTDEDMKDLHHRPEAISSTEMQWLGSFSRCSLVQDRLAGSPLRAVLRCPSTYSVNGQQHSSSYFVCNSQYHGLVLARATYAKRSRRRLNAFRAQAQ